MLFLPDVSLTYYSFSWCAAEQLFVLNEWFLDNPIQANWGGDLRETQLDFPCLLAISAFDRIDGLYNRHLNSHKGVRLR